MKLFSRESDIIYSPVRGSFVPLCGVGDDCFSMGLLGRGIALRPAEGVVYAPCDARVEAVMPHALNLITTGGALLLIHVGIDTLTLEGRGFENLAGEGESVKRGEVILRFDLDHIKEQGLDSITMMTVSNHEEFPDFRITAGQRLDITEPVICLGKRRKNEKG